MFMNSSPLDDGICNSYDYSFKILLIGDSGVGKSSLLLSFISNSVHDVSSTIGVDFKIKHLTVGGKKLKLTIWDTDGGSIELQKLFEIKWLTELYKLRKLTLLQEFSLQERFGTLMKSYYRGAHGLILVYDVTRRETFTNLSLAWAKEVELYSTNPECVRVLVGNKVDKESEGVVTTEEGLALAEKHKCSFFECSAKTRENVQQCFQELILKILEVPSLLEKGSDVVKKQIMAQKEVSRVCRCCS